MNTEHRSVGILPALPSRVRHPPIVDACTRLFSVSQQRSLALQENPQRGDAARGLDLDMAR